MTEDDRYIAGMTLRRAVPGDARVDRSLANLTDFNRELQAFITRTAWATSGHDPACRATRARCRPSR